MKKVLRGIFCLLVIASFIVIGYYTYKSYDNKKDENNSHVELNNYYNSEYLFNSNYIQNANTVDNMPDDSSIKVDFENDTMVIKSDNSDKRVKGVPDGDNTVYYNYLYDDYYEFLIKKNGVIYYAYVNIKDKTDSEFSFISGKIKEVYIPVYDKKGVFVNSTKRIATQFILSDKDGNLKYIDYDKEYILKDHIEDVKPYFDYICASDNMNVCNNLLVYITFNDELFSRGETVKYNNKKIYIKDVFSSLEVNSDKNINISSLSMSKLKKYNYKFDTYIIDKNGIIYDYVISNTNINIIKKNDSSNKVKEYLYESKNNVSILTIIFENGTKEIIQSSNNRIMTTSTIYDKSSNNEKVLTP